MSVEDPLEEEKREKVTPRTTPLYYLLAFIFTLTIGTACFFAGKWSVDGNGVELAGTNFELHTVTSSSLHLGDNPNGSSATPANTTVTIPPPAEVSTAATTEAATVHSSVSPTTAEIKEITETAEWVFAEVLSTTAFTRKTSDIPNMETPTTVPTETTTEMKAPESTTEEIVTVSTPKDGTLPTTSGPTTENDMSTTAAQFGTAIAPVATTEDPPVTETSTAEQDGSWTSASELFIETRAPLELSTTEDPDTSTNSEGPETTTETSTWRPAETTAPIPTTTTTEDPVTSAGMTVTTSTDCPPEVDDYRATTEDWMTTAWPVSWPRPVPNIMRIWPAQNRFRDRQLWKRMRDARREMNDMLKLFNQFLHDTDNLF